ncbi:fimbria/pilus outer membrane usher protein [Pseudomonas simiae]|uniref:fimbria/pilus outer membrane usher protein n=1 Tax=Pseudomonas simiae TaxID=321846 RepID=UPI001967BCEB|nr:fimbria/pilus outer membrane usher protein [Pseudomonas simiae]QRR31243.1 fimbria/pilus outer membrane usher protein [Pseudomonas simiae]
MQYCPRRDTTDQVVVYNAGHRFYFQYAKFYMCLTASLYGNLAYAGDYFDPAFLSKTPSNVADLSRFETSDLASPGLYRLDLYLNGAFLDSRDVLFEAATAPGHQSGALTPCFTAQEIGNFNINPAAVPGLADVLPGACVPLDSLIPSAKTVLTLEQLRLDVSLPQAVLNKQARGLVAVESWDSGLNAFLLNYNFTGARTEGSKIKSGDSYFLNLDSGFNLGAWRLRNNSTVSNGNRYNNGQGASWKTLNSYALRALPSIKSSVLLGDTSTSSAIFNSFSFRGAQLSSDDNMLADSERGFAPVVRGIANSNAEVIIRQGGNVIYQTYVAAGPFAITDIYPTASNGDLQVSVVEADGRVNRYSVPFASLPILQREGRLKYDLVAGTLRNTNYQTSPTILQGTMGYGLSSGMTIYGGMQNAQRYQAYSIGVGQNLGYWGAASLDITAANSILADDSEHSGYSLRMLYAKTVVSSGTNFKLAGYQYSTRGFYNFTDTASKLMERRPTFLAQDGEVYEAPVFSDYYNLRYPKRTNAQLNISQPLGSLGSMYVSGSRQTYWNTPEMTDLFQAGYQTSLKEVSYTFSYSYNKGAWIQKADQVFALNVSIPLGSWLTSGKGTRPSLYATYGQTVDDKGYSRYNAGVSGTALENNNLNYSAQQSYSNSNHLASSNVSAQYRGGTGNANMGYSYSGQSSRLNYGVSGGIVAHEDGVTFGQPLGETNILVKAPRAKDVRVSSGVGITTDRYGYAVVPSASNYRENRVALETGTLANNIELDNPVAYVVPTRGALVRADFDVRVGVRALMSITHKGRPVPFGASVIQAGNANDNIVGNDGQVFLSGLALKGQLKVQWKAGADGQCTVDYQLDDDSEFKKISKLAAECV